MQAITSGFQCSRCDQMLELDEVAYHGPLKDGKPDPDNTDCNPFMDFGTFCARCYRKVTRVNDG